MLSSARKKSGTRHLPFDLSVMKSQLQNLWSAVELSEQITILAQKGDWQQMAQLDQQRFRLLEALFSDQEVAILDEDTRLQLQNIIKLNDQALKFCAESKASTLADSRRIRRGKEAVSAYQKQHPGH